MTSEYKDITVIIPAYNEEDRIGRCIESCLPISKRIIVLDNQSTDDTCVIAEGLGAEIVVSEKPYKERLSEAIERDDIDTRWILYIDADEQVTEEAVAEISDICQAHKDDDVNGVVCRYRKVFMGKDLFHSGSHEYKMRLFKKGTAFFECDIELDEHMKLKSGRSIKMKKSLRHFSYKDTNHLITKHNSFALRRAQELIRIENGTEKIDYSGLAAITKRRRRIKFGIYYKLPVRLRAWMHYAFCYYIRGGFLDGIEGKLYLFYRIYWYDVLTDTYYLELKRSKTED